MKYICITILALTILSCHRKSTSIHHENNEENRNGSDLTNNLIGVWEFVKTIDYKGNKVKSIQGSFGTMEATGPKLIYNENKTYEKIFTPEDSDNGWWRFNSITSTIEHDLFIDSTDWIGQDLIKRKLALKKSDGNYYELIEDKIIKMLKNEMWIENRGLIDVYRRLNN